MRAAVVLLALGLVACRTVWHHPDATAQKYADDTFFCQYGIERSEWVPPEPDPDELATSSERAWALQDEKPPALGPPRPSWKRCMVRLGWDTSSGFRDGSEWRVRIPPRPRRR